MSKAIAKITRTMLILDINNPDSLNVPDERTLSVWCKVVLNTLDIKQAMISIQIVNTDDMQYFNRTYRHKDKPTNILSFPFEQPPGLPQEADMESFLGDLIICPIVLESEATQQSKLLDHHWCHILIHGILHLLGYDHIEKADADKMENLEISLLAQLGIDNPYVEK
ncbi:rRNA maturation RNase YbeY [Fastidiosibacter lacustris]|uniref:rRNA maturation RNase YbeY n=1 Tax=Fastidiosibacter lacustris TaxID=2056695 RepID=UPI001EFEABB2|nr:rRNA maturation RNase YbeY [Fastidiosibacter lacustris]